jgi:hypothetical protein
MNNIHEGLKYFIMLDSIGYNYSYKIGVFFIQLAIWNNYYIYD